MHLCKAHNINYKATVSRTFKFSYYIVPNKCTECTGFHEEPQCAAVCPVDCCVPDPDHVEDNDTLAGKQKAMHG